MRWTTLLVLLFGLLLVGLTYFFYTTYKAKTFEGFQVNPNVYYVESDRFLDSTNLPTACNLGPGYSTIAGVRTEFISILNDYKSYAGWQDRFATPSKANTSYISRSNVRGVDFTDSNVRCRNTVTYTQGNNTIQFCDIISVGVHANNRDNQTGCPGQLTRYFMAAGYDREHTTWPNRRWVNIYENKIQYYNSNNNKYISYIQSNSINNSRNKLLFSNDIFNVNSNIIKMSNVGNFTLGSGLPFPTYMEGNNDDIKDFNGGSGGQTCGQYNYYYGVGELRTGFENTLLTVLSNQSKNEEFKLNVYGDIYLIHLSNFKRSQLFGVAFNFTNTELIDLYLNVPFASSNLNGDGYFSFGYFKQDVPTMDVPNDQLYKPNTANISYNKNLITTTPNSLNIQNFITSDTGVRNLGTNTNIGAFAMKITPELINILPNTVKQYVISWVYNRTITVVNTRLSLIVNAPPQDNLHFKQGNINQRTLLVSLALSNYKEASAKYTATGLPSDSNIMSNWSNYLNKYAYAHVRSRIRYDNLLSPNGQIGGDGYQPRPRYEEYQYADANLYYSIDDAETAELIACADSKVVFWTYQKSSKKLKLSYALRNKYSPSLPLSLDYVRDTSPPPSPPNRYVYLNELSNIYNLTYTNSPTTVDELGTTNTAIGYNPDYISGTIVRNWKIKRLNMNLSFSVDLTNPVFLYRFNSTRYQQNHNIDGNPELFKSYIPSLAYYLIRGCTVMVVEKVTSDDINWSWTVKLYFEHSTGRRAADDSKGYYYATTEGDNDYTYTGAQTYSNINLHGYDLYNIDRTGMSNDQLRDIAEKNTLINSYTYTNDRCWFKYNFNGSNDNNSVNVMHNNTTCTTVVLNRKRVNTTIGTTTPMLDSEMGAMRAAYTQSIYKYSPKYSDTANVNSSNFLNAFAQMYYDKSQGTEEPVFIYDVYRVDSNMVDIRFDSQRRMNSNNYRILLDKYRPQVERYNRLYDLYTQGTWQNAYSNISDLQFDLSNSLASIEPVLNPVYSVGDIEGLINLSNANKSIMIQLSNNIFGGTSPFQKAAALGSNRDSAALLKELESVGTQDNSIGGSYDEQNNWYFSTIAANDTLTNLIGGFKAKVARAFITIANGSNIILESFAMGPNAATSYHTAFNAGIETVIDSSPGNVNYQPLILYRYNTVPRVSCSNIEFMRRGTQAYMDTVFTDLSGHTSNFYSISNGEVRVDKITGFEQISDNTCGFTWTESQYDYATNKKFISRTRNVIVPYLYDESIYQNPQLYIDSNLFRYATTAYSFKTLEIPDSNIPALLDDFTARSNTNRSNINTFLNTSITASVGSPKYYDYFLYPNSLKYDANNPTIVIGTNNTQYRAKPEIIAHYNALKSHYDPLIGIGNGGLNPDIYTQAMTDYVNSLGTTVRSVVAEGINLSYYGVAGKQTIQDNYIMFSNINITPLELFSGPAIEGPPTYSNWFDITNLPGDMQARPPTERGYPINHPLNLAIYVYRGTTIANRTTSVYIINVDTAATYTAIKSYYLTKFYPFTYPQNATMDAYLIANTSNKTVGGGTSIIKPTNSVADDIDYYYSILNTSLNIVNGLQARLVYANNGHIFLGNHPPESLFFLENALKNKIILPGVVNTYSKLINDSNFYKTQISGLVRELALNESNVVAQVQALGYYTIPKPMMQNTTLVDADGACPTLTCTDPTVMTQLLEQYNLDSNSPDTILRILKGVTPNKYQCDYLVEIRDKNSNIQQQTKSFLVGIDILDCSYYLGSNVGANTGYFIQDNTPFTRDSPDTDLSGFQYIGGAFLTYSNAVNKVLNPLIANAITSASNMYNAFTVSRLATYDALGRMKYLQPTVNCKLTYPALRNLFTTNIQFCSYIFDTYPFLDRYMNTILRVAIYDENTIIVVFNEENLYLSKNGSIQYGGVTTTSAALYTVFSSSEDSSCKYRAQYLSSTPMIIPPKEYMRSMLSNTHLLYGNGYANILDDLNIKNKSKYINIEPLSKKTLNLVVDYEQAQNRVILSFKRAQKISCYEILYKIEYSTGTDIIYCAFKKAGSTNVIDIITRYYTNISAVSATGYTSTLIPVANLTPLQTRVQSFYQLLENLTPPITIPMISINNYSVDLSTTLSNYFSGHGGSVGSTPPTAATPFKENLLKLIGFPENPINYRYKSINSGTFSVEYVITDPTVGNNLTLPIEDTNRIATFYFDILNSVSQNNLYSMNRPTNIYTQVASLSNVDIVDLVADNWGYVYITDSINDKIHYLTTPLETVAGNGTSGYFVYSQESNIDLNIATSNVTITYEVTNPENRYGESIPLNGVHGITSDSIGNLYTTDSSNGIIRYIDTNTYIVTSVAGTLPVNTSNLTTTVEETVTIKRYTNNTVLNLGNTVGPALSARLTRPKSIAADSKNNVYFVDQTDIKVLTKNSLGSNNISMFTPIIPPGETFNPSVIRIDKYDNIYCIQTPYWYEGHRISKITPTSNYSIVVSSPTPIDSMTLDSSNNLYYSDTNGLHCIRADSNIVYIPLSDLPSRITSMDVDPTTNKLYMSYTSNIYTIPLESLLTYIVNPVLPNPTINISGTDHTVQLLSVVPATGDTTSFLYDPMSEPTNTAVMNYFRQYYNASHSVENGNANNSILSRIYSAVPDPVDKSITYTVSVYHTDQRGEYITDRVPNDMDYNNTLSYTVKFLEQSGSIYNLTYSEAETPAVLNPVVDQNPIEHYGPEYYLPKFKYTNLRFTPISVNPIVDARIISAWQNYASAAPLYALSQLQFYLGETSIFLYTQPNSYNYLLSKANIQIPNPARIQTYQNYYKMGALQPNGLYKVVVPSIQFDLKVPTNLDGFSFVSGNHSKTSIQQWVLEGSIDNGSNWINIHSQTVPFSSRNPIYPSAFYQTPIFPFSTARPLIPLPQIPAHRRVSGFTNYTSYSYKALYLTVDDPSEYRINRLQFFDIQKRIIPHEERKSENKIVCILEEPQTIFGYSFITNSISSTLDPRSWRIYGSYDGSKWVLLDKKINYTTPNKRLYQLPIFTIENSGTYDLPQPKSRVKTELVKTELVQYYREKINPYINPNFKKVMYDNDMNIYYVLFDEYDLNRELIASDQIVGFSLKNNRVKSVHLYTDEYGTEKPYDLSDKEIKKAWDRNVGLNLNFIDF